MKKFIIFDVDGTLLDTEKMYMKSLQLTLANHGIEKTYAEVYKIFGLPSKEALEYFNIDDVGTIQAEWQSHYHDFWSDVALFNGITTTLANLKRNNTNLAIVTSNTKAEFTDHIDGFDIVDYFDAFVFAGETRRMKPFPDPILAALEKLDANAEQSVYIGDSIHDMKAAHAAGIDFALASWSIPSLEPFNDLQEYTLTKPSDILNLLTDTTD
ncbi:HAD family hydrolase [Periweissella fabalis]|uniref:HAD family hydrolase n=1 Tax=Periweissella fabalis TaxID=1070421 RepID=A0A7X6S1Q9_9LACO|nr:HAD family hydrolase [Periweissella fabalis]MCM0598989.1 HAD family hydrolase [Periweissella fabalis]NKZ23269.1 HAD family hydrolase [Periweissella fabalis]